MGMYDEIRFHCPNCLENFLEQTKARDEPCLAIFPSTRVLSSIAAAMDGIEVTCSHCHTVHVVQAMLPVHATLLLVPLEDPDDPPV